MPIVFAATLALQLICIVHAVRSGRTQPWLFVILFLPLVGCAAYFIVEVLPGLAADRRGRKVAADVKSLIDPDGEFRRRKAEAELTGTPAAKAALAKECLRKSMFDEAADLYNSALTGLFADDPNLMLGLAEVYVERGDFVAAQATLERLREKNPDFESTEGHLLYARALDGQGKEQEATEEYAALIGYFPGFEAKVRYALFLRRMGAAALARELLEGVVADYRKQPRHARELNRDWYEVARSNLEG